MSQIKGLLFLILIFILQIILDLIFSNIGASLSSLINSIIGYGTNILIFIIIFLIIRNFLITILKIFFGRFYGKFMNLLLNGFYFIQYSIKNDNITGILFVWTIGIFLAYQIYGIFITITDPLITEKTGIIIAKIICFIVYNKTLLEIKEE